ncbi:MAG: hypothetical protein ACODAD_11405 [Planctomycetota bacterium]
MNAHKTLATGLITFCLLPPWYASDQVGAGETEVKSVLATAKDHALETKHRLEYKFTKGEVVQWQVRHLGTTEAKVQGNTQTSKMRAVSTKQWEIVDVDDDGNATFVHSVLDVDMWQKVSGREEIRYNSAEDENAPPEYRNVAKTVGVPLATVKISPSGNVLERDKTPRHVNSGLGEIAVPLPTEPVKVGQNWKIPNQIRVRRRDGQVLHIKTRLVYTLESVNSGVATINIRTEVVTPVNDPQVEVQLVQQLLDGELEFDLDAGRVMSRQVDWDKTVVGFNGDDSLMKYLARFTEELIPAEKMASQPAEPSTR